ncbi:MAG: hypothetical protein J5789_03330, partial [Oscillospiraceae bacterium]|nr:hypothetical protein [Oscillospiraceae bacterium]
DRDGGGWRVSGVRIDSDNAFCKDTAICETFEDAIRELKLEKPLDHSENMGHAQIEFFLERGDEWIRGCLYEKGLVLYEPGNEFNSRRAETYLFSDGQQKAQRKLRHIFVELMKTLDD